MKQLRFSTTALILTLLSATTAFADLTGPSGGPISDADFVDVGFFNSAGHPIGLIKADGLGQMETKIEVGAPVNYVEPDSDGGALYFYTEMDVDPDGLFGGEFSEIEFGTVIRMTTTLNLDNSDPFNIWTGQLNGGDSAIDIFDGAPDLENWSNWSRWAEGLPLSWLPTGIEVSFNGTPVSNLTSSLMDDNSVAILAFDPVSGTGEFEVSMYYEVLGEFNVGGVDLVTGETAVAFHEIVMNASSGDTTPGVWITDDVGSWSSQTNWQLGFAPSETVGAVFGDAISQSRTIVVPEDVATAGVEFDSAHRYVIAGPGTVYIESESGDSVIESALGGHEFQAKVSLQNETEIVTSAGSQSITFNNSVAFNGNTVTISGPGSVRFNNRAEIAPSTVEGDYNNDSAVNSADYTVWRNTLGEMGVDLPADGNGDEIVDESDYDVWKAAYGDSAGGLGTLINQGNVGGSGRINATLLNEGGTVTPGQGVGRLLVDGDYIQESGASLALELGGLGAGAFDVLEVAGEAAMGGNLLVALVNAFSPAPGATFDVLTASSISNQGLAISGSPNFSFAVVAVTGGDVLRLTYNGSPGSGFAVPEPTSIALLGGGLIMLFGRRRQAAMLPVIRRVHSLAHVALVAAIAASALCLPNSAHAQAVVVNFSEALVEDTDYGDLPDLPISVPGTDVHGIYWLGDNASQFIPGRIGEQDAYPDNSQNGEDAAFSDCVYCSYVLFDGSGFADLTGVHVESVYVGRDVWGGGFQGDIVGYYEDSSGTLTEIWRDSVNLGPVGFYGPSDGVQELYWTKLILPQAGPINHIEFASPYGRVDDLKLAASTANLDSPPSIRRWIAGANFGTSGDAANYTPANVPNASTDLVFDLYTQNDQIMVTDQPLNVRSLTSDHEQSTMIIGSEAITFDSNLGASSIDVLQGSLEFQAIVNLSDPTMIEVAEGASLIFNNVINLSGHILTIAPGSNVVFNNRVILAGGSINGSFGLGSGGMIIPEPTAALLACIAGMLCLMDRRRRKPRC